MSSCITFKASERLAFTLPLYGFPISAVSASLVGCSPASFNSSCIIIYTNILYTSFQYCITIRSRTQLPSRVTTSWCKLAGSITCKVIKYNCAVFHSENYSSEYALWIQQSVSMMRHLSECTTVHSSSSKNKLGSGHKCFNKSEINFHPAPCPPGLSINFINGPLFFRNSPLQLFSLTNFNFF